MYFSIKSCFVLFFHVTSDSLSLTCSGSLMSHSCVSRWSLSTVLLIVSWVLPLFFSSSAYVRTELLSNLVGADDFRFLWSTPVFSAPYLT